MLQVDYERGTNDSDIFETAKLTKDVQDNLLAIAGVNSALQIRRNMRIDIVRNGIPFLPQSPVWHAVPSLNKELANFEVFALDIVDVVVSKLKRFHANDANDVKAMIDRDLVPHDRLLDRFRSAVSMFEVDARAAELERYVNNLHRVERDFLDVAETEILLPSWI